MDKIHSSPAAPKTGEDQSDYSGQTTGRNSSLKQSGAESIAAIVGMFKSTSWFCALMVFALKGTKLVRERLAG